MFTEFYHLSSFNDTIKWLFIFNLLMHWFILSVLKYTVSDIKHYFFDKMLEISFEHLATLVVSKSG